MEKSYNHHSIEKKWKGLWGESSLLNQLAHGEGAPETRNIINQLHREIVSRREIMQQSPLLKNRGIPDRTPRQQTDDSYKKNRIINTEIQEAITRYGYDSVNFNLAIHTGSSADIFSTNRLETHRAFANKIWNASRYVILNLRGNEDLKRGKIKPGVIDRWFLHSLNNLTDKVSTLMDQGRVPETAKMLYHFFWNEFCRWYLEYSKTDIQDLECRKVLKFSLRHLMRLLHPFLPCLTEEIFEKVKSDDRSLQEGPYPAFSSEMAFPKEYSDGEQLKMIVNETRKLRTENKMNPQKTIRIILISPGKQKRTALSSYLRYFNFLIRSNETRILDFAPRDMKGFKGKVPGWDILIPFENPIHREQELNKLEESYKEISNQIQDMETKLADQQYLEKTSGTGLSGLKKRLLIQYEKREKLRKTIGDLT